LISAAATICAIMNPDESPGSGDRNGGSPSLMSGFSSRSMRRSVMLAKSVSAIAA
jgi:hypothetical protein